MSANRMTNIIIVVVVLCFLAAVCFAAVVRSSTWHERAVSETTTAITRIT